MNQTTVVSTEINGQTFSIETGKMAKQAGGSVVVRHGECMVLVTAVAAKTARTDIDFFPLTCNFVEKYYSTGKFPGGFFKREGRPTEKDTLTSRLMDRPIRPNFVDGFKNETQVIATVLSADKIYATDVMAVTGASAALHISDIPYVGPMACVRVGRVDGKFICNPTIQEQAKSDIDLIVAGSRDAIQMVEGGALEVPEEEMVQALEFAHASMQPLLDIQDELRKLVGKAKREVAVAEKDEALKAEVAAVANSLITEALKVNEKHARYDALDAVKAQVVAAMIEAKSPEDKDSFTKAVKGFYSECKSEVMREQILSTGLRIGDRKVDEVRAIECEVGVLPRAHGSCLFTRGETQALVVTTLGTGDDVQRVDSPETEYAQTFMLHYNFPPFSVGEARFLRGPGRREIGHGKLAERSLLPAIPSKSEDFPYTVRLVSETLESNGSSSMAAICGGSLALFDAGVNTTAAVAGIAMGLIMEGERYKVLSDILGDEDHLGDMDFKVAGTAKGITGFQMDLKIKGLSMDIMREALAQAQEGRMHILGEMAKALDAPRTGLSEYAPRFEVLKVKVDRIRDIIGPGGKTIRGIVEKTGAKIEVEDSGLVRIASPEQTSLDAAVRMIRELTQEAEVGKLYLGQVKKITDFGAFVEIFPGTDGLVHISQLAHDRVNRVEDIVREGDEVLVRVLEVDSSGKIRLSRKDALSDGPS